MRDFKSMKRQRGRNRSGGASGGGKPQQNANRAFESNGPDNLKIRGHAQHVYEKYQQLARDAMSAGDRVLGENFLQHAEHYFRLIRTLQPTRPYTDIVSREGFASGYDIDFEDEGGEGGGEEQFADAGEGQSGDERGGDYRDQQPRQDRWENREGPARQDQNRQDPNRQDPNRQGGERQDYNRDQNRQDQNRQGGYANDRTYSRDRNDRWENRNGGDAPRLDNNRDAQGRDTQGRDGQNRDQGERVEAPSGEDRRPERQDRYEQSRPEREGYGRREGAYGERAPQSRDPLPVIEPQAAPLTASSTAAAPVIAETPAAKTATAKPARTRVLRSQDGDESHTPAFLQAATAPAPAASESAPVKRARGRPKKVEAAAPDTEEV
jgi:hypothetical protein